MQFSLTVKKYIKIRHQGEIPKNKNTEKKETFETRLPRIFKSREILQDNKFRFANAQI